MRNPLQLLLKTKLLQLRLRLPLLNDAEPLRFTAEI